MRKKLSDESVTKFDKLSKIINSELLNETNVGSLTNQNIVDDLAKNLSQTQLEEFKNIEILSGDKQHPNAKITVYILGDKSIKSRIDFYGENPLTIYGMLKPDSSYVYIVTPKCSLYVNDNRSYFKIGRGKPSLLKKHHKA